MTTRPSVDQLELSVDTTSSTSSIMRGVSAFLRSLLRSVIAAICGDNERDTSPPGMPASLSFARARSLAAMPDQLARAEHDADGTKQAATARLAVQSMVEDLLIVSFDVIEV